MLLSRNFSTSTLKSMLLLKFAVDKNSLIISEMRVSASISVELMITEGANSCLRRSLALQSEMLDVTPDVIKVVVMMQFVIQLE